MSVTMPGSTMLCPRCWGSMHEPGSVPACTLCKGAGVTPDQQLSEHCLLSELLHSDTAIANAIPNDPTPEEIEHLRRLCVELLEPIRELIGPLHVTSGFRSHTLNAVRAGSRTSAHMEGFAADLRPLAPGVSLRAVMEAVRVSPIEFDQLIFEGSWVHAGLQGPEGVVRREVEMAFPNAGGRMVYQPYDPADPRVLVGAAA